MAGLRALLARLRLRFRPVSTPGPAAAVPADRSAELAAELGPSLDLLEEAQAEARAIRERAAEEAERLRRDADREAGRIVAAAEARAGEVRRRGAEQARAATTAEADAVTTRGEQEAARLRRHAGERMPDLADEIVADLLREMRGSDDGPGPHDCPGGWCEGRPRWAPDGSPG